MPLSVKSIDHLVIRVADLDAGEKLFTRLGFTLTPRVSTPGAAAPTTRRRSPAAIISS